MSAPEPAPAPAPVPESSIDAAARALASLLAGRRTVALVGAGLSTESGIPDYRGAGRSPRTPITHREFLHSAAARARYWARSVVGWPAIARARPNAGHLALAALERHGAVTAVVTQNVDGLHHAAGSARVVELHGSLWRVRCLDCGAIERRDALQARLLALNPAWQVAPDAPLAPDGDAEVDREPTERHRAFCVADCASCGGLLKPDVVFFGDNVARPIVDEAYALVDEAEALVVLGSSLTVWSGFRFVRRAAERGRAVAIANLGPTRGDPLAALRVEAPLGALLPRVYSCLTNTPLAESR
jgi:NAD-dependent SIR2 family protein deacetylase